MRLVLNIVFLFLVVTRVLGQNSVRKTSGSQTPAKRTLATFSWNGYCRYKGTYDVNVYSSTQIRNTHKLSNFEMNLPISYQNIFDYPDAPEYAKVDLEKLDAEYNEKIHWFRTAELASGLFWQQLRERRIRVLEQNYERLRIAVLYNSNPSILKNNRYSTSCDKYVKALTAKEQNLLISTWRQIVNEQKKDNGSPDELEKTFQQRNNSADRIQWAKYEVLTFGWFNCAVTQVPQIIDNGDEIEQQFNKLFIKVSKTECGD